MPKSQTLSPWPQHPPGGKAASDEASYSSHLPLKHAPACLFAGTMDPSRQRRLLRLSQGNANKSHESFIRLISAVSDCAEADHKFLQHILI